MDKNIIVDKNINVDTATYLTFFALKTFIFTNFRQKSFIFLASFQWLGIFGGAWASFLRSVTPRVTLIVAAWAAFFKSLIVMHCVISSLPQTHCPIDNVVEFILSTYTALQNSLWFIAMLVSVPDQPWLFRLTWEQKIFPVPIPVIVSVPKFYSAGRGTTPKMENSCEFSGTGTKFVRYWYRYFFRYQILPVPLLFSVPNFTGTGPGTFFRYHLFPLLVPVPPKKTENSRATWIPLSCPLSTLLCPDNKCPENYPTSLHTNTKDIAGKSASIYAQILSPTEEHFNSSHRIQNRTENIHCWKCIDQRS